MTAIMPAIVAALLTPLLLAGCGPRKPAGPPNIVLIITDDQRWDAMGCAGRPELRTPNLDRIAAEGTRFTNAFVTTSLCSPSRASILTGCYAHTHGVVANELRDPPTDLPTLATVLHDAGYRTAFAGKWHMQRKATPRPGFDDWISFTGQGDYYRNTWYDNGWRLSHEYVTDELTHWAEDYIRRDEPGPFLLVISHKAAHEPFYPARRHVEAYRNVAFAPESDPDDDLATKPDWGGRQPRDDAEQAIRAYHQCLLAVDESVGAILQALEERGILDETVVVYTGDNGYLHGEHGGLWDKRAAYEPSIRVPLLMRYPYLGGRGETCDALVLNVDITPTLLDLAGVTPPPSMQGTSWRGVLEGKPGREAMLYEYFKERGNVPTIVAVRTRDWKLVTYPENREYPEELYDLHADPRELKNLAPDPGYKADLRRLRNTLREVEEQTDYRIPLDAQSSDRP